MVDGQDGPKHIQNILDPVASGEVVPAQTKLVRRRLILKGLAAGVPAVITLQGASSAAAAATSSGNCITGSNITSLASYGTNRCVSTAVAATSIIQRYNRTDTTVWGSTAAAPCTAGAPMGAIYTNASGVAATSNAGGGANYWGGNAGQNVNPAAGYYAVTKSCWGSFH
ncbi:MAG: hypothetical protein HQL78_02880 [Magnetococcales bacterium]|nr:hypothetical protein [Magnetococcales bacterium]MBF0419090.1 hypothetical protein [Magnetococcales bacterium]